MSRITILIAEMHGLICKHKEKKKICSYSSVEFLILLRFFHFQQQKNLKFFDELQRNFNNIP